MEFLIVILIGYYVYTNVVSLVETWGSWETVQWVLAGLTAVLIPIAVLTFIRGIKNFKNKKAAREAQEAEAAVQREAELKARFLDDFKNENGEIREAEEVRPGSDNPASKYDE